MLVQASYAVPKRFQSRNVIGIPATLLDANTHVFYIINGALDALALNFLQSLVTILWGNIVGFFPLGLTSVRLRSFAP